MSAAKASTIDASTIRRPKKREHDDGSKNTPTADAGGYPKWPAISVPLAVALIANAAVER